jgi:hypothetical protein
MIKKGALRAQDSVVLQKNPDMVTRVIDKETILLPVYKSSEEINCIYTLDHAASRIWQLIDGKKTVAKIKETVLNEFDTTPGTADKEIQKLLKDFKAIKAII